MHIFFTVVIAGAWADVNPDTLRERGVRFYLPFEESPNAVVSHGASEPWAQKNLKFVEGKIGMAVKLSSVPDRTVRKSDGSIGKVKSKSILAYETLGNVLRRRGTIAFWVRTPWDGMNKDILSGSSLTGPTILSISAEHGYAAFFYLTRRKAFFEALFGGKEKTDKHIRLGTYGTKLVPRWQKNLWQHVAVTWDDRRGYGLFFNGKRIDGIDRKTQWHLPSPDLLAFATRTLRSRDIWPVSTSADFDEFIVFDRPLDEGELQFVLAGQYSDLRKTNPDDWPIDLAARSREFHLQSESGRPVFKVDKKKLIGSGTIEQIHVDEIDLDFHRRWTLADGTDESSVRFQDGQLLFSRRADFRFAKKSYVNHVVTSMDAALGSVGLEEEQELFQIRDGHSHQPIPPARRDALSIRFAEDAVANEVRFFDVSNEARITGERHYVAGPVEASNYQDARNTLLRWPHPEDGPLMGTLTKRPDLSGESHRPSLRSTFFVIGETKKDVFVRSIGFDFWMKCAKRRLPFSIHIHDPQLPGRLAFESDFELEMVPSGLVRIRLSIRPNGLVIPPGKHLVIQIVAANDYQLFHGAEYPSFISISQGDRKRIGHELAQKILRSMWPAFLRRLNQNRFKLGEETYETNPIARGLELALKYDPLNQQAHSWYGWSRLRPWPEYSFRKLDRTRGPAWAVYGREAIRSTQQVIHWWLDHRAHENGYLVGGGNQWNDITKLYNKYLFLCGVTRDERLLDAIERYLDAHWNTGRMVNGAIYYLTDITHSVEEATYIQPALQVLRPGLPRHFYRDLLNAANLKKWLGRTSDGHLHFRSSFFNAAKIITDGEKGRDIPGCEPALVPARFLSWYSGHPEVRKMVNDWSRSWLEDALNETTEKPEGALPRWVKFRTHELGATGYAPTNLVYEQFLASFQDTGDNRFLEPFVALLESGDSFGDLNWHIRNAPNLISWRILSGDARSDNQLRELSKAQIERFREDAFFQRGIEYGEGKGMLKWVLDKDEADLTECLKYVIRNNHRSLPIYGPSDPPTDRVYPWGRVTLPVMMLGGRLFDGRASDPVPTAAFIWDNLDPDLVSMVFDYQPNLVRMLVHNFRKTPEFAALRLMNLPEGRYQVIVAKDEDGAREPDRTAEGNEADLRRFTKHNLVFESGTNWVELKLLKRRKNEPRPDLAVTVSEMAGQEFTVTLHNLGPASAKNVEVSLRNIEPGRTDAPAVTTTNVGSIQGLTGFERQTVNLKFKIPEGATPSDFYLVVDPGNAIDEINESNNSYALSDGVPPPVESKPKTKTQ